MARLSSLVIISVLLLVTAYFVFFHTGSPSQSVQTPEASLQETNKQDDKKVILTNVNVSMPAVEPIKRSSIGKPGDIQKVGIGQD